MDTKGEYVFPNSKGEQQTFAICEHEDGIELVALESCDIDRVVIPETIHGKPVTLIGDNCFFLSKMKNVQIPPTVEKVGIQAFAMCQFLEEIIFPNSVIEIGEFALRDCRSLKKVILSDNIVSLPTGLFGFCYLHEPDIHLPKKLKVIEQGAFWSAGHDYTVLVPDSVEKICVGAFTHGPAFKTSLPYDEGWISWWPYGEMVNSKEKGSGTIIKLRDIGEECSICTVSFSSGTQSDYFYPCDFEGDLSFSDSKNVLQLLKNKEQIKNAKELYKCWLSGLL